MRIAELPRRARWACIAVLTMAFLGTTFATPCRSAEKAAVAANATNGPILFVRDSSDKPWKIAADLDVFPVGAQLVGGANAAIDSYNGAVRVSMRGDVAGTSPFPVMETSLVLEEPKDVDLAVEMNRGRINIVNRKASGPAKVKLTLRGKGAVLTLAAPGDTVVVEIFGRWRKGQHFIKNPKGPHAPTTAVIVVAVKGDVHIKGPQHSFNLTSPPGPALMLVNDVDDPDPIVQSLEKLPDWVTEKNEELYKKFHVMSDKFKELAAKTSITEALGKFIVSDDKMERWAAVVLLAGLDELKTLAMAMNETKHPDVWNEGVISLRNWIGRGPGQDMKLYDAMINAKIPEGDATVIMQLLHSFSDAECCKPAVYEALIDYLNNDRPAIRGLAHWHLIRLVPEGRKIPYNMHGTKEEHAAAVKAWQALIPPGRLPGEVHKDKK